MSLIVSLIVSFDYEPDCQLVEGLSALLIVSLMVELDSELDRELD